MSASQSKVVVDNEGDLSSSWKTGPLPGLSALSKLTFFLKWEFWMILFRAKAFFESSISKFGKAVPQTDREDFNSSNE